MTTPTIVAQNHETWFDYPRGLSTLFMTEMWERFTHYGMRAILVLFPVGRPRRHRDVAAVALGEEDDGGQQVNPTPAPSSTASRC